MWLAAEYEQGWFGEPNSSEALKWYKKSAAKGNRDAQAKTEQANEGLIAYAYSCFRAGLGNARASLL